MSEERTHPLNAPKGITLGCLISIPIWLLLTALAKFIISLF